MYNTQQSAFVEKSIAIIFYVLYYFAMKLSCYLSENNLKATEFAAEAEISLPAVYKYLRGERIPNKRVMPKITKATNGLVTANDFFESYSNSDN